MDTQKGKVVLLIRKSPADINYEIVDTIAWDKNAENMMWQKLLQLCASIMKAHSTDYDTASRFTDMSVCWNSKSVRMTANGKLGGEVFYEIITREVEI